MYSQISSVVIKRPESIHYKLEVYARVYAIALLKRWGRGYRASLKILEGV